MEVIGAKQCCLGDRRSATGEFDPGIVLKTNCDGLSKARRYGWTTVACGVPKNCRLDLLTQ